MTRAMERLTLTHATARSLYGQPRRTTSRRASSTSCRGGRRARAAAAGLVVGLRLRRPRQSRRARNASRPRRRATRSATASLGEGVVTRIEPGGVVTVRFASDGSERRLMLEYAPLEKIALMASRRSRPCSSLEEVDEALNGDLALLRRRATAGEHRAAREDGLAPRTACHVAFVDGSWSAVLATCLVRRPRFPAARQVPTRGRDRRRGSAHAPPSRRSHEADAAAARLGERMPRW